MDECFGLFGLIIAFGLWEITSQSRVTGRAQSYCMVAEAVGTKWGGDRARRRYPRLVQGERRKSRRNRPLPRDAIESQKCRSPHSDLGLTVKRQRAGPISTGGPARFHDWEFR